MANKTMNFKADLLPNTDLGYSLGSSNKKWNIYGTLTGNASSATKLGNSNLGSATKPIYLNAGTPTECNTYAGGTAVTLNNSSKAASTASFYAPTTGGTSGYPLIGDGTTSAPIWHGGLVLSGTAASSYIAAFKGTTDAASSTEAAVTIAGGLAVNKKIYTNSEFYIGTDNVGKIYSGADYTLSGSATVITNDNISTYFTINNTDQTYPWGWDTTNNCWALNGTTQGIHNINNVVMAEWKALSNFALIVEATVNSEHNFDYFEILVNGTQKFTTKGGSGTNVYNVNGNVYLKSNDIVQFRFKKDGSGEGNPEYYHAILKRQSYSSVAAVQIVKNLLPTTSNTQNLGSSAYRWAKLYLGSQDTYGSSSKPIYWSNGVPTECSATIPTITLNGTATASASFYAPTSSGTSGYFLKSNGANTAPTWTSIATTDTLVKQTAKSDNVNYKLLMGANSSPSSGTAYEAVYDTAITVNPSTDTITATNFAGTATKATKLTNTSKIGDTNKPVYFTADGVPAALTQSIGNSTTPVYLNSGTITLGSVYAGGTAVTLNGTSKASSTASFYAPTSSGTIGYPLIGAGNNTAPIWHGGLIMTGTAASSYVSTFKGTTDATSSTAAAVVIAGGLAIAKKLYNNSEFYIGNSSVGQIYSGAEYTLSGSTTTITLDNFSTYFSENSVDQTYPWTYNTANSYWESSGTTEGIDNIASVIMAEWTVLSKMALHIDYTINSESQTADYLRINVNGVNKFQKGGRNINGRGTIYLSANDIIQFILRKDSSISASPECYRAVLSRQNYSSVAAVQVLKNLIPSEDGVQNLGASSYRWAKIYLGSSDSYGSSSTPIYWNNGTPAPCTVTIPTIKLNGSDTTSANFYAPTSAGTANQLLKSNGANAAPTWFTPNYVTSSGVTSITIQTTSPVSGGSATATTTTGSYTISLADGYGDTKNPYASKTKNYVLAAGATSNSVPSFRALVAADIPKVNNAVAADKLSTARTLWGQSFDGTANVSGSMTDVGPQLKLPSGQTDFQFLTSGNGAANGKFGKLGLADSYSNIDLTNYRLDVYGGSQRITTGFILFNNSADGALLKNKYSSTEYNLIRNHNNGNISISASSAGLYMGYENTTFINWKNGAMQLTTDNKLGIGTTSPSQKLHVDGGLVAITNNSNTVTIGSQNSTYTHIYNSADIPFIFNKDVNSASKNWLGSTSYPWGGLRLGGTGEIQYQGTKANYTMIKMIDNTGDTYGNGIRIGGGGLVLIGGGESATTLQNNLGYTGGSEATVIGSDGAIYFYPGQDSYDASALLTMTASRFCAGVNGDTTREAQVQVASGGGSLYLWSPAATSSDRGLYAPAHGTGTAKHVIRVTTNNRVYFCDSYNDTATALAYSQSALAASAITYLTCWNGYELRAITKAEMANAVDSAHKWVRIGGDTVTGQIQKASLGKSWFQGRDGALIRNTTTAYTNNWYNPIVSVKSINGTWDIGTYTTNNSLYFTYITDANYNSSTNTPVAQMEFRGSDNSIRASKVYGAVWNDYAEMRNIPKEIEMGRCVRELGDGRMILTTERLQRGCKVTSDTFGFNIGETEECKTPIAVSGRALVYIYEGQEEASKYIGWPVCSGPNGTVSIMTEEEEEKYPSRIVGTISEIPNYEEWGTGKVKVNGRIWIYVK